MENEKKYTAIGGQAVIEGVMMRGLKSISIAVRKPNGEIEVKSEPLKKNALSWIAKVPFLRGAFALVSSMVVGVKALTYSAEFYMEDEEEAEGKFEKWIKEKFGEKAENIMVFFSILFSAVMAILMFAVAPTFLISLLKNTIKDPILLSSMEGILKIVIFVSYIFLISRLNDVKRVFQYHGAEHKCIYCFESGKELTVENAREFGTLHPRCGTSFLLIVMGISIAIFTFVGWNSTVMRMVFKVLLFPVIAGLSYEVIKWAGKNDNLLVKIISYPGFMMQKLTTNEPDDEQLEVALVALKSVLEYENDLENATNVSEATKAVDEKSYVDDRVVAEGGHAGESS